MSIKKAAYTSMAVIFVLLAIGGYAYGQAPQMGRSKGKTSAETLRDHGIDSSESSLLLTLHNPDSKLRVSAAYQLARDHRADAVPAVEEALANEKETMARVGLATALASLHDPVGFAFLQARCSDAAEPDRSAIASTEMIETLGGPAAACVGPMLTRLDEPRSRDYRDSLALVVANLYSVATKEQGVRIVEALQKLLIDTEQQPSFRLAAGQGLAQIGLSSSAPFFNKAISEEGDPVIRTVLRSNLEALHKDTTP